MPMLADWGGSRVRQILMPTPDLETPFRSFAAGSTAGVSSVALTYPLELIRVRLAYEIHHSPSDRPSTYPQIMRLVANEQPPHPYGKVFKFYRGFMPTLVGMVPYAGTSFLVWDQLRAFFIRINNGEPSTVTNLACGAAAGVLSQTASYPFEVVRRRMQVHPLPFWETIASLYRASGLRGFYVGLSIGYLKVVPMTAIRCVSTVSLCRAASTMATASPLGKVASASSASNRKHMYTRAHSSYAFLHSPHVCSSKILSWRFHRRLVHAFGLLQAVQLLRQSSQTLKVFELSRSTSVARSRSRRRVRSFPRSTSFRIGGIDDGEDSSRLT